MRLTIFLAASAILTGAAQAEPAKLAGAVTFYDEKRSEGPCAETVTELIYQDGFSSIQFTVVDFSGKELRKVAFIGPRWTPIDTLHSSMVINQLLNATVPIKQLKPVSLSGFCISTVKSKEDKFDHPYNLVCEYNTQEATHLFTMSDIVKREGNGGM